MGASISLLLVLLELLQRAVPKVGRGLERAGHEHVALPRRVDWGAVVTLRALAVSFCLVIFCFMISLF